MTRNKIIQWLLNNKTGFIIGFIFGAFIAPFLAVLGLGSAFFMNLRPLLIGPMDLIKNIVPNIQTGPLKILTLGFNGICYAVLAGIVYSIISKNNVRK